MSFKREASQTQEASLYSLSVSLPLLYSYNSAGRPPRGQEASLMLELCMHAWCGAEGASSEPAGASSAPASSITSVPNEGASAMVPALPAGFLDRQWLAGLLRNRIGRVVGTSWSKQLGISVGTRSAPSLKTAIAKPVGPTSIFPCTSVWSG